MLTIAFGFNNDVKKAVIELYRRLFNKKINEPNENLEHNEINQLGGMENSFGSYNYNEDSSQYLVNSKNHLIYNTNIPNESKNNNKPNLYYSKNNQFYNF